MHLKTFDRDSREAAGMEMVKHYSGAFKLLIH